MRLKERMERTRRTAHFKGSNVKKSTNSPEQSLESSIHNGLNVSPTALNNRT